MPRKRRQPKRRIPQGLAEVSLAERARWLDSGPLVASDVGELDRRAPYTLWPDWPTWAAFYAAVRDTWSVDRPWIREKSAAERLFAAHLAGENLDAVRHALAARRRASDPRTRLRGN